MSSPWMLTGVVGECLHKSGTSSLFFLVLIQSWFRWHQSTDSWVQFPSVTTPVSVRTRRFPVGPHAPHPCSPACPSEGAWPSQYSRDSPGELVHTRFQELGADATGAFLIFIFLSCFFIWRVTTQDTKQDTKGDTGNAVLALHQMEVSIALMISFCFPTGSLGENTQFTIYWWLGNYYCSNTSHNALWDTLSA